MKTSLCCLLWTVGVWSALQAKPLDVIGDDDASKTEYGSTGWSSDKGDGTGFGKWVLRTKADEIGNSHAGFYIAGAEKPDLNSVAIRGKAFGMYANGVGFEMAAAFRDFDKPLKVGQSFSFLVEHGEIVKKFEVDAAGGGSLGVTLRSSGEARNSDDYNNAARFEFGYYQGQKGYVVYDGEGSKKLDIPFTDAGLSVTFTLLTADTYNLEVTTLVDRRTVRLMGRKLGGATGAALTSFCLFDRNGERDDVYFNGFQILQEAE